MRSGGGTVAGLHNWPARTRFAATRAQRGERSAAGGAIRSPGSVSFISFFAFLSFPCVRRTPPPPPNETKRSPSPGSAGEGSKRSRRPDSTRFVTASPGHPVPASRFPFTPPPQTVYTRPVTRGLRMKVLLVPSAPAASPLQYLTTLLVND